jgi:putative ABC transport system permease protein
MFGQDAWQEIFETVRGNLLRTSLTGFSVAWGVLILVVLLGSGQGLERGIKYQFRDDASNSIWVSPGQTSVPFRGGPVGRRVQLRNSDFGSIKEEIQGVEHITARFAIRGNVNVTYGGLTQTFPVRSVHPDHVFLENTKVETGRFVNQIDIGEYRKVAVLGRNVVKTLFPNESPLGKNVKINGVAFKVVGTFFDDGNNSEMDIVYLPISTAQRTFGGADRINQVMLTTGTEPLIVTEQMSEGIRGQLAEAHRFAVEDQRAIFINNINKEMQRFLDLMAGVRGFIWLIGIGTLLAGVVGVSNILMISVHERTREIGIRKALGATPGQIVALIVQEAVLITSLAGYLGLLVGLGLLELFSKVPNIEFFRQPGIQLSVGLQAMALLVVAGGLAGFFPARRAAKLRPIDALRDE